MRKDSTLRPLLSLVAIALVPVALVCGLLALVGDVDDAPAQAQSSQPAEKGLRVYVIVLDGLMPHEIREPLTPTLAQLKAQGTWYEQARAVFPAETIPNHVAMMTGVPPQKNGIVGNDYWIPGTASKYRMQYPSLLGADTLTTRLEERCTVSTATVQSKGYLWGIFRKEPHDTTPVPPNNSDPGRPDPANPNNQRQADLHWVPMGQPGYINDPDDHVIDQTTMTGFLDWIKSKPDTPQFAFVNLGDIDRAGHVDLTGNAGGVSAFRQAALADTDQQVKRLVDELKASGAWQQSVLVFTSDHGMDWSPPDNGLNVRSIDVTAVLSGAGYSNDGNGRPGKSVATSKGDFHTVPGGGTATVWLEDPANTADVARTLMAWTNRAGESGVDFVATREPVPGLNNPTLADLEMDHPNNGDIVVFAKEGWAVRDRTSANPIPGNHGHAVTQHSTLFVTGGSPLLDDKPEEVGKDDPPLTRAVKPSGGPGNLSVAPTVAALFGLGEPAGGYSRAPLAEAFKPYALAPHQPCQGASPPPSTEGTGSGDDGTGGTDTGTGTTDTGTGATDTSTGTTDTGDSRTADATDPPPAVQVAVPRLRRLTVTPSSFVPKALRPRSARVRRGAIVSYTNTEVSRTTFTVRRLRQGYRRGDRCVLRRPRAGTTAKRCWTYVRVRGSFAHRDVAGRNAFRFTGWVGGRKLRPGAYRLRAVAWNAAGRSRVARTGFRITRP